MRDPELLQLSNKLTASSFEQSILEVFLYGFGDTEFARTAASNAWKTFNSPTSRKSPGRFDTRFEVNMKRRVHIPSDTAKDLKKAAQTGPGYQVVSVELDFVDPLWPFR